MNKIKRVDLYESTRPCPICKSDMHKQWGSRGYFFSCNKYPNCKGSRDVKKISFTIMKIDNTSIMNDSYIDCTISGKSYTHIPIVMYDTCFGIEIEDSFIPLKQCEKISLSA